MLRQNKNFKSGKFYSEEEVNELIENRVSEERARFKECGDAFGKSDKETEFENERAQYLSEKMEFETAKLLMQSNLPLSFARILSGDTEEECAENVRIFKAEFSKAIESDLNTRLRGRTPLTSSVVENNDPFLTGFGN